MAWCQSMTEMRDFLDILADSKLSKIEMHFGLGKQLNVEMCTNGGGEFVMHRGNDKISYYTTNNRNQVLPLEEGCYRKEKGES